MLLQEEDRDKSKLKHTQLLIKSETIGHSSGMENRYHSDHALVKKIFNASQHAETKNQREKET